MICFEVAFYIFFTVFFYFYNANSQNNFYILSKALLILDYMVIETIIDILALIIYLRSGVSTAIFVMVLISSLLGFFVSAIQIKLFKREPES
jgi:hypothetical protein